MGGGLKWLRFARFVEKWIKVYCVSHMAMYVICAKHVEMSVKGSGTKITVRPREYIRRIIERLIKTL
jgi:hypothetical protein